MSEEALDQVEETSPPQAEDIGFVLSDDVISDVVSKLQNEEFEDLKTFCLGLNLGDLAELIQKLWPEKRKALIEVLSDELDPLVFTYISYDVRLEVISDLDPKDIAAIVRVLDSDDALDLVEDLDEDRQKEVMRALTKKVRASLEEGLTFPEDSAGRLMQREFIAVPQFWTVGRVLDFMRMGADNLPSDFYDIFVVDPMHHVIGEIPLSRIVCTKRDTTIEDLITEEPKLIPADMDQEDVVFLFRRDDMVSAPVVDADSRLIGVITVDDIVDVIDEEHQEDMLKMAGVEQSDIYRATLSTAKARFSWLAVNLLTAIAASVVIGFFEATIDQVVALAVLMPIVASMGGNAGTQTMTVAVRALATKDLSGANALRVVTKELMVGVLNGVLFAIITGLIAWLWFSNAMLGGVIAAAMVINLIVAGVAGVTIPLAVNKMGWDPALSSSVFLTTVTDVLGFFAFLGLAALFLI